MPEQDQSNFKKIRLLGEGAFGKAYLVQSQSDQSLFVVKEMDMRFMSEDEKQESIKEARIMAKLRHPNIINFRSVHKTKKGKLCIVMDYADGGDLYQKIKSWESDYIPEQQVLDWFTQLCLAVKHIHDRKVIHRDIKSQNVFLTCDGRVKLGDFGIARVLRNTREKAKTIVGTPYYLAPELIENKPYSFHGDMWSLGVLLYEMCARKQPFEADSLTLLALKIVSAKYPPLPNFYSKELRSLVGQLLTVSEQQRPTVQQVLSILYFSNKPLEMPIITNRIKNFLSETLRMKEFCHTVLHNINIFSQKDFTVELYDPDSNPQPNHHHQGSNSTGASGLTDSAQRKPQTHQVQQRKQQQNNINNPMFPEIKREAGNTPKHKQQPRVATPTHAKKVKIQNSEVRKMSGEDQFKLPEIKQAPPTKNMTPAIQIEKRESINNDARPPITRQASRQVVPDYKAKQNLGRISIQTPDVNIKQRIKVSEIAAKPSQTRIVVDAAIRYATKDSQDEAEGQSEKNQQDEQAPQKQNFFIEEEKNNNHKPILRGGSAYREKPKLVKSPSVYDALLKQSQRLPPERVAQIKEKVLSKGGRFVISDGEKEKVEQNIETIVVPEVPRRKVKIVLGQAHFERILKHKQAQEETNTISYDHGVRRDETESNRVAIAQFVQIGSPQDEGIAEVEEAEEKTSTKRFDLTISKESDQNHLQQRRSNSLKSSQNETDTIKSSYVLTVQSSGIRKQTIDTPLITQHGADGTFNLTQSQIVESQTNLMRSETTIKKFVENSGPQDEHSTFDEKAAGHNKRRKILVRDPFSKMEQKQTSAKSSTKKVDSDDDVKQMLQEMQTLVNQNDENQRVNNHEVQLQRNINKELSPSPPIVQEQNSYESIDGFSDGDEDSINQRNSQNRGNNNKQNESPDDQFVQTLQYLGNKKEIKHLKEYLQDKLKQHFNEIYQLAKQSVNQDDLGQKIIMQKVQELIPKSDKSSEGVATLICTLVVMQKGEIIEG